MRQRLPPRKNIWNCYFTGGEAINVKIFSTSFIVRDIKLKWQSLPSDEHLKVNILSFGNEVKQLSWLRWEIFAGRGGTGLGGLQWWGGSRQGLGALGPTFPQPRLEAEGELEARGWLFQKLETRAASHACAGVTEPRAPHRASRALHWAGQAGRLS